MSHDHTVELFTPEEHRILSAWFELDPLTDAKCCTPEEALERLGVDEEPAEYYTRLEVAVAFIVLEATADALPNCGVISGDRVELTRKRRPKSLIPARRVAIMPRHLFTLNWADTAPGISWPGAYYATWVPLYERTVVTYSADTPEVFGYCDIALGHFGPGEDIEAGSRRIITDDWRHQYDEWGQSRWAYLFASGVVGETQAEAWADTVWQEEAV